MSKELTEKQRTVIGIFLLTVLGAFALILLVYKRKFHPAVLFFVSVIGSGVIEYATGWVLYNLMGGVRLWDYNVEIWNWGNIDGYVCARSVLIFGVFGMVYGAWIIPRFMEWIKKVKAKPVAFRLTPGDRGGTSRDAKLINNLIYDCGVGAIYFPTKDNMAEGNAYVKQAKGGDLRIMYPAPEVCLDLKSWREFYGFDQTGSEGWFDFEIDTEKLTLEVKKSETTPPNFGGVAPGRFAYAPQELQRVAADPRVF